MALRRAERAEVPLMDYRHKPLRRGPWTPVDTPAGRATDRMRIGALRLWHGIVILVFLLCALFSASFLVLNMPPFQNADETNHFLRADNVSRGYLIGRRIGGGTSGGIAAPEIDRADRPFDAPKFHPERKVALSQYQAARLKFDQPGAEILFPNTAIYPPFFYAPSVLAIWIGKAGRMDVVQTLYLARAFTALASATGIATALIICFFSGLPGAALVIFVLATLPMTLSLQSACSQDGPMLAAGALAAALFARLRANPRLSEFALLCVCLGLVAAARPPYAALALIPLGLSLRLRERLLGAGLIVAAGVGWFIAASLLAATPLPSRGTDIAAQAHLLLDPAYDWRLLTATLAAEGWRWVVQAIGQLGWLDVVLADWVIRAALVAVLLACITALDLRGRAALAVASAVFLAALGVVLSIYLIWTPASAPVIQGVQGRYFLPPLMLLAGLGTTLLPILRWPIAAAALLLPVATFAATMRAVVVRYYLGA